VCFFNSEHRFKGRTGKRGKRKALPRETAVVSMRRQIAGTGDPLGEKKEGKGMESDPSIPESYRVITSGAGNFFGPSCDLPKC